MQPIELDATEDVLWWEFETNRRRSEKLATDLPSAEELAKSPEYVAGLMMTAFAEAVWQGMKRKNLTSAALARELGVSRQAVSEILAMERDMRISTMARLSAVLNLGLESLFLDWVADPPPAPDAAPSWADEKVARSRDVKPSGAPPKGAPQPAIDARDRKFANQYLWN